MYNRIYFIVVFHECFVLSVAIQAHNVAHFSWTADYWTLWVFYSRVLKNTAAYTNVQMVFSESKLSSKTFLFSHSRCPARSDVTSFFLDGAISACWPFMILQNVFTVLTLNECILFQNGHTVKSLWKLWAFVANGFLKQCFFLYKWLFLHFC